MQRQPEPREAIAQFREEAFSFRAMLKSNDKVIGETDDDHVAAGPRLTPSLDPEVERGCASSGTRCRR